MSKPKTSLSMEDAQLLPPYEVVRTSCQAFASSQAAQEFVTVNVEAARNFGQELNVAAIQALGASSLAYNSDYTRHVLSFDSIEHEMAYILLFHALDFGSGWRHALHRHHRKGAFQTIQAGVENLFQKLPGLKCSDLLQMTKENLAMIFLGRHGNAELDDFVDLLYQVIQEVASQVATFQQSSLVEFVQQTIVPRITSSPTPAGDLIWILIDTFPQTFDDSYELRIGEADDEPPLKVCLYKKAQLVVGEVYHRFRNDSSVWNFPDGNRLTAYIDNVICATLRYQKVVVPCPALAAQIDQGKDLVVAGSIEEVALRAAACVGVEEVVRCTPLTPMSLDKYLWGHFGKIPEIRNYERHATKTIFY